MQGAGEWRGKPALHLVLANTGKSIALHPSLHTHEISPAMTACSDRLCFDKSAFPETRKGFREQQTGSAGFGLRDDLLLSPPQF